MLTIDRLTPAIGAVLSGLDFSQPLSVSVYNEIYQALLDHLVILSGVKHWTLSSI